MHNDVRIEIRVHDARQIGSTVTRDLVAALAVLNGLAGDDPTRLSRFVFDTGKVGDLALYAEALPKLVAVGAKIPVAWAHEKLRIPLPEADEEVLRTAAPTLPTGQAGGGQEPSQPEAVAAGAAAPLALPTLPTLPGGQAGDRRALAAEPPDPSPVGDYTEQMERRTAMLLEDLLATVHRAIERGDTLEQMRETLLGLFGDLDTEDLQKVMATAFACADLAGRVDVLDER